MRGQGSIYCRAPITVEKMKKKISEPHRESEWTVYHFVKGLINPGGVD